MNGVCFIWMGPAKTWIFIFDNMEILVMVCRFVLSQGRSGGPQRIFRANKGLLDSFCVGPSFHSV